MELSATSHSRSFSMEMKYTICDIYNFWSRKYILASFKYMSNIFWQIYIRGVSEKYPTCVHISALGLFFVIQTVASFEVVLIWWTTRSQRCFHILKQSSNADFAMAFSSRVALLWIISMSSNRFPLSAIFNFGNIQKSQGATSGLYEGWRSCTILCFAKNCCTRFDECAGALSRWRSQSPLDQKRGRFLLTASRNLFRTST